MPTTTTTTGEIVSTQAAPENLDTIDELAAAQAALTNTVGFVVAGAPSDANSLERLNANSKTSGQ